MITPTKFSTDDFVAPYKCFIFVFNDLGFNRNDSFLPGRIVPLPSTKPSDEESSDLRYFSIIMVLLASLIALISSMSWYGVYHISNSRPSTAQRLFIYTSSVDTILAVVALLCSLFINDPCTKKVIIVTTGVYSMLTRVQTLLVVCILRLLAISTNHFTIGLGKKTAFFIIQVTFSTVLALLTGYVNMPAASNFNLFTFHMLLISCIVVVVVTLCICINIMSSRSLQQQQRKSFKVITAASSRGNHHKVAMNKLAWMSTLVGLCYFVPSIYYLFVGARFATAKQRDFKIIQFIGQMHWFQIPVLLNPLLNSLVYMFVHKEVGGLYGNIFCRCINTVLNFVTKPCPSSVESGESVHSQPEIHPVSVIWRRDLISKPTSNFVPLATSLTTITTIKMSIFKRKLPDFASLYWYDRKNFCGVDHILPLPNCDP